MPATLCLRLERRSDADAGRPHDRCTYLRLELALSESYLDYGEAEGLARLYRDPP